MDGELLNTRMLIERVHRQGIGDDPLALLDAALEAAAGAEQAADAVMDHFVAAARSAGLSWTVIGQRLGVSKQAARQRFADRIDPAPERPEAGLDAGKATIAPQLAACLEAAQAAADADDSAPGTQHLLLGLLHGGQAAAALDQAAVTRDKVRQAALRLFEPTLVTGDDGQQRRIVGDGAAPNALAIAHQMAARRGQSQVRTEHLLFTLITDEGSAARRVLDDLGVEVTRLKKVLNQAIPPRPKRPRRSARKHACDPRDRICSFCASSDPARPMVAGPGVWICGDCIALATDILATDHQARRLG